MRGKKSTPVICEKRSSFIERGSVFWMSRSAKAFIVGLITAILGGFFSITAGQSLETRVGLDMLF
jgi:hypothetical protein